MNVPTIEMPREVARGQLRQYRAALHKRADAEYQEIALGLEELAKGTPLLQLSSVFADVPLDEQGRPRLAIARADRMRVKMQAHGVQPSGLFSFNTSYEWSRRGPRPRDAMIQVQSRLAVHRAPDGYAIVPIIPPAIRPSSAQLSRHFILWEVERWADTARQVGPDVDPLLLRRISSDLWAVVGQWDLSPIEQAILAGRRER